MTGPLIIWAALLVILTLIHVIRIKKFAFKDVLGVFLLYVVVINIGLYSLYNFFAHLFYPDEMAKYLGWGSGSQFQYEVGIAYLAFGILGILCFCPSLPK